MLENEKDILNHTWHVRKRISGLAGPDQTFTKVFLLQNGEVKEVLHDQGKAWGLRAETVGQAGVEGMRSRRSKAGKGSEHGGTRGLMPWPLSARMPEDAWCGWSVDEESTHGHVSSSRAAASVNTHTSQGTAQPQAQAGKGDLSGGQEPGVTQEHARFVIAGMAWHKEEIYN